MKEKEYSDIYKMRHSAAHVMAQAVKAVFPDAQMGMGPPTENGFFYDFDRKEPFTEEDLSCIEKKMQEIIKANQKFEQAYLEKNEAVKLFSELGETYKVKIIEALEDQKISVYRNDTFVDLCKGPHVESTGRVKAVKLLNVAGAYWLGDEKNPMLQRIYAAAFSTDKELRSYLNKLEEAKKRDHRKLGPELGLFTFDDKVGAGLVLYQPKGATLRSLLEDYIKKEHIKRGYEMVIGPHIMKSDIWIKSGHYEHYKENMYIFEADNNEFAIKPMNCPAHILIYQGKKRSYRDLPIRYFELGTVHRFEKSGVLHGLLRVRGFTQDDAHLFCRRDQIEDEIVSVLDFVIDLLKTFGFNDLEIELSTRPEKSIGTDEEWNIAEEALKNALERKKLSYEINAGDGAFYGPKIDIKLKDALERSWQCATIQCDFALPDRFQLKYTEQNGEETRPIMLHRAILGSVERFLGTLIEHYAGKFPMWLAPVQCMLVPISEKHNEYAQEVKKILIENGLRVELDERSERMQKKIKDAQANCIPRILIMGDKEKEDQTVSVRYAYGANKGQIKNGVAIQSFVDEVTTEVQKKEIG